MSAQLPIHSVLQVLVVTLLPVVGFGVPIWVAHEDGIPLALGLSAWGACSVAMLFAASSACASAKARSILPFAGTCALTVWVPIAVYLLASSSLSSVASSAAIALLALMFTPSALLPMLPLWSSALPPALCSVALVAILGARADNESAWSIIVAVGASLLSGLLLLTSLSSRYRAATMLKPRRASSARTLPCDTTAPFKPMKKERSVPRSMACRVSQRVSAAFDSSPSNARRNAAKQVDLLSQVDRARYKLQELESLAASAVSPAVRDEISQAIGLLKKAGAQQLSGKTFDWSSQLKGVDRETAAFLKNTLSADYQRRGFLRGNKSFTKKGVRRDSSERQRRVSYKAYAQDGEQLDPQKLVARATAVTRQMSQDNAHMSILEKAFTSWDADMIALHKCTNGHALLFLGREMFRRHKLLETGDLDEQTLTAFLVAMEDGYGNNPYHSSIHGADVLMSTNLFFSEFQLAHRLEKIDVIGVFIAAILHDFNHPGTTNAFEMKILSPLAITYSDRSPLEHSHLASSFAVINATGFNVLGECGSSNYLRLRRLVITIVLHTDLAKHFEVISRLQALATEHGARAASCNSGPRTDARSRRPSITGARKASITGARKASITNTMPTAPNARRASMSADAAERRGSFAMMFGRRCSTSSMSTLSDSKSSAPGSAAAQLASDIEAMEAAEMIQRRQSSSIGTDVQSSMGLGWVSPFANPDLVDLDTLVITMVKFADLGHCFKTWSLHREWTERVTEEFWMLGDRERELGVPIGPLCDRHSDTDIPKSQIGFFQFICTPFYSVVADLVDPAAKFLRSLKANQANWQSLYEASLPDEDAKTPDENNSTSMTHARRSSESDD